MLLALVIAGATGGCQLLEVPPPPPAFGSKDCIGVPEATCQELLQGRISSRAPVVLVGYRVTCKVASCTADAGEAQASLLWADGTSETFASTWFGPIQ